MIKRVVQCDECGNEATIYTVSREEICHCPFCGEPFVVGDILAQDDEDEDFAPRTRELEDEDWPESGC